MKREGFKVYMERVQRTKETGCGYALSVPENTDEAERLLRSSGIHVLGRQSKGAGRL